MLVILLRDWLKRLVVLHSPVEINDPLPVYVEQQVTSVTSRSVDLPVQAAAMMLAYSHRVSVTSLTRRQFTRSTLRWLHTTNRIPLVKLVVSEVVCTHTYIHVVYFRHSRSIEVKYYWTLTVRLSLLRIHTGHEHIIFQSKKCSLPLHTEQKLCPYWKLNVIAHLVRHKY